MNNDSPGCFCIFGAGFCLSCDHRLFWRLLHTVVWTSQQDAPNLGKPEVLKEQMLSSLIYYNLLELGQLRKAFFFEKKAAPTWTTVSRCYRSLIFSIIAALRALVFL